MGNPFQTKWDKSALLIFAALAVAYVLNKLFG